VRIAPAAGPLVDAHIWSGRISAPAFAVNRTASQVLGIGYQVLGSGLSLVTQWEKTRPEGRVVVAVLMLEESLANT
jgi:hypothetical protein